MSAEQVDAGCSFDGENDRLFVVGIGASAGGLEAIEEFLQNMPADSGAAFVIVQHLSSDFKSLLKELLERDTRMKIYRVTDGMELAANSIYLIPSDKNLILEGRNLRLVKREDDKKHQSHQKDWKPNFPIDLFFNSLAQTYQEYAIGVVLSGTGSDGSIGLKAISEAGGIALVQEPSTAEFNDMPSSAISILNLQEATKESVKKINQVGSPTELAGEIYRFLASFNSIEQKYLNTDLCLNLDNLKLKQITDIVSSFYKVDLSFYKLSTLSRRIYHRCSAISCHNVEQYIQILQKSDEEKLALFQEISITVTSFFRDTASWNFLAQEVIPDLINKCQSGEELRFWVSACATGEEAYSLAILIDEALSNSQKKIGVKIFATDINEDALKKATEGIYQANAVNNISRERLDKYFICKQNSFQVKRKLRDMLIFAFHNLTMDVGFTRINLLSCRNILMYMQPEFQQKVLKNLHFSLKNQGVLFLGHSENLSDLEYEFIATNPKYKVYRKRQNISSNQLIIPPDKPDKLSSFTTSNIYSAKKNQYRRELVLENVLKTFLFANQATCFIVDNNNQVVEIFEDLARVLKIPTGAITTDVNQIVLPSLQLPLNIALSKIRSDKNAVTYKGIKLFEQENFRTIQLTVDLYENKTFVDDLFMVSFQEENLPISHTKEENYQIYSQASERISQLENELYQAKSSINNLVTDLQYIDEEHQATNEELTTSNEELQSTNEELISVNQELYTVNSEYQAKIHELIELNQDVNNLLRSTNIGVVFLDKQLRVRKFTPAAKVAINLIETDINRPLKHLNHNFACNNLVKIIEEATHREKSIDVELKLADSDEYLLMRITPYIKYDGSFDGRVLSFIDINEIKTAQNQLQQTLYALQDANVALRNSEERFRSLYLETPVMLYSIDQKGRILDVSNYWLQKLGYERQEVVGKRFIRFLTSESRHYAQEILPKFFREGSCWDISYRFVRKDGEIIDTLLSAIADKDDRGNITRTLAVIIDITERKKAEAALRESEARFKTMADSAPVLIWMSDANHKGIFFNKAWLEFTGSSLEQQFGDGWLESVHLQDRYICYLEFCSEDSKNQTVEIQFRLRGVDKQYYWMLGKQVPRFNSQGKVIGYIGSCIDITEIKNAKEQLYQANYELEISTIQLSRAKEAAESANQAKSSFIAHMSHELRTPLNGILGFAQIFQADETLTKEQRQKIDIIHQSGEHLLTLINDILNLSRIEANQLELELKNISFDNFIEEIVSIINVRAQQKNITFNYQALSPLPAVIRGDETRLRQVLLNLLGNAVKFTHQGRVNFYISKLGNCETPQELKNQEVNNSQCFIMRFKIEDTGVGIPPEKTREIFLPFHQLINGESLNEGSGLGLTISQKIVNLMGGEIKVEAAPGKGSCFYFDICFLEIENTQLNDNLPLEIQPVGIKDKHPKILVVDDNQINRAVVVNYLKRLGFEISEASNGKEGLEKVENLRPDLILLDLVMPIMDGFETTEALRNNPEFKDLPIIIISANAMFDAQLSSYRIGCNAFLSKPIDLKLLIKSIAQLIDLEWIYPQSAKLALSTDKPTQQIAASQNTDTSDSILAPSNEEVTQLLHLTQMGDIEAILDLAKQLESLDTKYLKFSQKVSELAQSFEQHKLLRFLEEFLK